MDWQKSTTFYDFYFSRKKNVEIWSKEVYQWTIRGPICAKFDALTALLACMMDVLFTANAS